MFRVEQGVSGTRKGAAGARPGSGRKRLLAFFAVGVFLAGVFFTALGAAEAALGAAAFLALGAAFCSTQGGAGSGRRGGGGAQPLQASGSAHGPRGVLPKEFGRGINTGAGVRSSLPLSSRCQRPSTWKGRCYI